jgi:ferredoxin--NADP+ reductase
VAPDHPKIKSVTRVFERTANQPGFRFLGNVEVGTDVSHAELIAAYDAVLYAVGTPADRRLNIPGEDLPGSVAAIGFVAGYNGHPDQADRAFDLCCERAVVVDNGDVALDVARMRLLAEPSSTLVLPDCVMVGRWLASSWFTVPSMARGAGT